MWPFRKNKTDLVPASRLSNQQETEASVVLTDDEREEVKSFYEMIHGAGTEVRQHYKIGLDDEPMASTLSATALRLRVLRLAKSIELGMYHDDETRLHLTDNILSAATKAFAIHPTAIHLYHVACAMDLAGLHEDAEESFGEFLRLQSGARPDDAQETLVSHREIRSALAHATARVSVYRAAA